MATKRATTTRFLPDEFLACRAWRHHWAPSSVEVLDRPRRYVQVLVCRQCDCRKRIPLDSTAHRDGNVAMAYPRGYLMKGRADNPGDRMATARLELVRRELKQSAVDEVARRRRVKAS